MSITNSTAAKNACTNARSALVNGGSLVIATAGGSTPLATFTLANPAFGSAVNGVATANSMSSVTAANTGTAAIYIVKNSSGTEEWRGDVGAELTLSSTSIVAGMGLSISSFTHAALSA